MKLSLATMALAILPSFGTAQTMVVDPALPEYTRASGVSGKIQSIGSDTMNNLMTLWGEGFKKVYPNTQLEIEGKGSSTAPPALISGTATFGPMSRPMKQTEIDAFEAVFSYRPITLRTAIDALAVFVHKDCPLDEISLTQLEAVFSVDGPATMTWGELGVTDPAYRTRAVSLYGRNSASGTYGFFKKNALRNRDFKSNVKEQPGSSAVVQSIAIDRFSMGYSGLGYVTAGVKPLKIAVADGEEAFAATAETAYSGDYALARYLLVGVNYAPRSDLDPLRAEFIKMIFSKEGQEVVIKDGSFPVSAEIARKELAKVGIVADF